MARVFNIGFNHQGRSYSALVSIRSEGEKTGQVNVNVYDDHIQIILPYGNLRLMIQDIIRAISQRGDQDNLIMQVTDHISLHLLNPV
jgi:hypothetical protein